MRGYRLDQRSLHLIGFPFLCQFFTLRTSNFKLPALPTYASLRRCEGRGVKGERLSPDSHDLSTSYVSPSCVSFFYFTPQTSHFKPPALPVGGPARKKNAVSVFLVDGC